MRGIYVGIIGIFGEDKWNHIGQMEPYIYIIVHTKIASTHLTFKNRRQYTNAESAKYCIVLQSTHN